MKSIANKAVHYLYRGPTLGPLLNKLKNMTFLSTKILVLLGKELSEYCQVVASSDEKIIILTANGSIATRIHFLIPSLLEQCQQDRDLKKIKHIHCKVRSSGYEKNEKKHVTSPFSKMTLLSPETARLISSDAAALNDPLLKKAMEKIASRIKK